MPLNVGKFGASWFLVLIFALFALAQSPTSGDVMRERITKAKALIAVKSYAAAIYELEGIRRETNDTTVNSVVQVMLMNCYLEQADYKRAQTLLSELYNQEKAGKPNANYFAAAAQIVKGARSQLDRYKSLGLTVSDRSLPSNAAEDINKMRETVETVITQSKTFGADKKQSQPALALLEEAINARSGLARDDYDAKRWKEEVADARESLMSSRSVVNAVDDSAPQNAPSDTAIASNANPVVNAPRENNAPPIATSALNANSNANEQSNGESAQMNQVASSQSKLSENASAAPPDTTKQTSPTQNQTSAQTANVNNANAGAPTDQQPSRSRRVDSATPAAQSNNQANVAQTVENTAKNDDPLAVGSLLEYATQKVNPVYPPAARTIRTTGVVRVELVVNEDGKIAQVKNASGPSMLQRAATDAVKQWKFKPFTRDGQPVKATGFVSFNFSL